jgi:hypothetical protein
LELETAFELDEFGFELLLIELESLELFTAEEGVTLKDVTDLDKLLELDGDSELDDNIELELEEYISDVAMLELESWLELDEFDSKLCEFDELE